ncbi:MAG: dehydrogenase [Proteobacteria bacterium SG_bin9]|nr:MAG: dehydrogenase [Proteobacteria bacterium SG_bin9]
MSTATINGRIETLTDNPDALLVDVLRGDLKLTGTKLVCGGGVCGACTVLVDGAPVVSCLTPVKAVEGKSVVTVEGVGANGLHPVQKAFMALDALQCGFCTPGFVVEAVAFHDRWRKTYGTTIPSRDDIAAALSGHLCRCGAYDNILRAVAEACNGKFDGERTTSPRVEARDKVTGAATYTLDVQLPGQLEGLLLRSTSAHARIDGIDLGAAQAMPGVTAVSLLPNDRIVRYVGEPIAAVAAPDRKTAQLALQAIRVSITELPSAIGIGAAREPSAPAVFSGWRKNPANVSEGTVAPAPWKGNVRGPTASFSHGAKKVTEWVSAARNGRNPRLVEATFHTQAQSHTCLEPHVAVANVEGDRVTIYASTQAVFHVKELVAKRFKLDHDKVQVIAHHIGGGFGSKITLGAETIAAVTLSQAAKKPVRIAFDRHEELSVTGYRPGCELKLSLLPSDDGKQLKALSLTAHADTGAGVNSTVAGLARLIYPAEAKYLADYDIVSNLPPGCAFRGPGGPPMAFAVEQAVDEAALRLNMDPIALRKLWDRDPNRQRLYDWAAQLDIWRKLAHAPQQSGRYRRGVGVATGYWFYFWQPGTKVDLAIENHKLVASVAIQDIGTGSRTVIANTVAREFNLDPDEIEVRIGDSKLPEGPASGGSRTTASVVPPTLLAIEKLKAAITQGTQQRPGSNAPWRDLIAGSGNIRVSAERPEDSKPTAPGIRSPLKDAGLIGTVFGWMLRTFSGIAAGAGVPSSVQVVEVEVDTWLGHVRVVSVHSGLAIGKIAAPALAHSQATGSIIQGIGYALYEAREVDPRRGDILSGGLEDYRIPGIGDTPVMDIHFDEKGFDHVLGGSVGIGEVATVPTSPAIANAIRNAIGIRSYELPIRPDRLVQLLKERSAA